MIKKLLLTALGVGSLITVSRAQFQNLPFGVAPPIESRQVVDFTPAPVVAAKTTSATMGDTLWYFFNKHRYKNAANTGFFYALCPMTGTLQFSHFGSIFLNTGTVSVTGLECIAARHGSSPSASVTIRMYLAGVSAAAPYALTFPPVDSLDVVATGTAGAFRGANFPTAKTINGNFAVLFKCIPTVAGDSVKLYMNNAMTPTATTGPANQRYGEGLSLIRFSGNTFPTTNLYGASNPSGTEYEYQVAPRMQYTVNTAQVSSTLTALCTNTAYTFNNASNFRVSHRQYNLNEFYRRWRPFANTTNIIVADSVFTWNFGDNSPVRYTTSSQPAVSKTYTNAGTYTVTLTSNLRKTFNDADPADLTEMATASKTVSVCDVGIVENNGWSSLAVYPNPAVNGKITITGLPAESSIAVYSVLGQAVRQISTSASTTTLDLSDQPAGTYFLKLTNTAEGSVKVLKVINQR